MSEVSKPTSVLRPETLERAKRGAGLSIQETKELALEIIRLRQALEDASRPEGRPA